MIDDKKARKVANYERLKVNGTIGILIAAKEKGFLTEIKSSLKLLGENQIHISKALILKALEMSGEKNDLV